MLVQVGPGVSACVCGVNASSAAVDRTMWPCPSAAQHVDKPFFTGSPTGKLYPLIANGL